MQQDDDKIDFSDQTGQDHDVEKPLLHELHENDDKIDVNRLSVSVQYEIMTFNSLHYIKCSKMMTK